jgi:Na+:H+ antiporter
MDLASILTDILVVLVAAKLAAEVSERVGVPAVVGEIVAGVLVGPSVLGLVGESDEVLRTLGELGVILLLLEVGMEMDLAELGKVGRASISVASVGVVAPLLLGLVAMQLVGDDFETSLFVAAALTATSVGITARVFGDLRALATTEARIVLGAAVADDVMGLVVLTVVVRLVTEGSVSLLSVTGIVLVAVGFLVIGGLAGLRLANPLFSTVERLSRSTGTLVALGFAFALGFARVAEAAKLAPIVGAFVAGIALGRTNASGRIQRELAPVGHLFIPVFFLQIGIDADIDAFTRPSVLRDAAILLGVAVVGKLISPLGALGTRGDKVLIGLGMLPRGEVGLIFATIGLQTGVLGDELYAALLVVVLATTLITPPLLKLRYSRLRRASGVDEVPADALVTALRAAIPAARLRPEPELLDWLSGLPDQPLAWDEDAREALLDVIERGNARSWRFLQSTGVLARALPEIDDALRARERESRSLDPGASHRLSSVERLRLLDADDPLALEVGQMADVDALLLALLVLDATDGAPDRVRVASDTLARLGVDEARARRVVALADDGDELLWAAAHRPSGLTESAVLPLATHLETPERARATYVVTALRHPEAERWEGERLRELHDLIQLVLLGTGLTGTDARNLVQQRRQQAFKHADPDSSKRIETAPTSFVLRQEPADLGRVAGLVEPLPALGEARVAVIDGPLGAWHVDVAARDRQGLLAIVSGTLAAAGYDVRRAVVGTWPDGGAVESFEVRGAWRPDADELATAVEHALEAPIHAEPLPGALVSFDDRSSPWHTICEVEATDHPGVLHQLATAFAAAGASVVAASIGEAGGDAVDVFEIVGRGGGKLTDAERGAIRGHVRDGATLTRRRLLGGLRQKAFR